MGRKTITVGGSIAALALGAELLLPRYLERRTVRALTAGGGSAHAELSASPAFGLLRARDRRLRVHASGLDLAASSLDLARAGIASIGPVKRMSLARLDAFASIDIEITASRAGPLDLTSATVRRVGGGSFHLAIEGSLTAAELSAFAGGVFRGGLGTLLGSFASSAHPLASRRIPLTLRAVLRPGNGRFVVESVDGTVAGAPGGAILEALVAGPLGRL